jgi:plastocyanin
MRFRVRPLAACLLTVPLMLAASTPSAHAIHFYRGPGGGCTPADGAITDDPTGGGGPVGAIVQIGHNTFSEVNVSGFGVLPGEVHVKVGSAVQWTWNSAHCHSVKADSFYSLFHYPTAPPESPLVAPGAFEYPILDDTPTLSYTHTFNAVGTYAYACEHHASIGMTGTVIVDP